MVRDDISGAPIAPPLLGALSTARSMARGVSLPIADRVGFRVDTNKAYEAKRCVFPDVCEGLIELGRD